MSELREQLLNAYMWYWADTAIRQCARSLSEGSESVERLFDAVLAVQSARNVRRAAQALISYRGDHWFPTETLEEFDLLYESVKPLRDILEHFDEYVLGDGNLQQSVPNSPPLQLHFDHQTGTLSVTLAESMDIEVNLRELKDDIATFCIDVHVDLDALGDEPEVFEELDGGTK